MAACHLFAFLILMNSNTGSSAGDTVYVQTGASVQLDIQREKRPAEFDFIAWKNEHLHNVVKYISVSKDVKVHSSYINRVDFNKETFSLTLKNMQKRDSGIYRAITSGDEDIEIAKHKVSVIDPVEAPVLTVISNSSSSDSCTINFTCTGHDLTLNSTYTNGDFSPENVTSQEFTLLVTFSENNIICNHSNPVSWKKDETDTKQFCHAVLEKPRDQNTSSIGGISWVVVLVLVLVVVAVVVVALVGYPWCKRNKGGQRDFDTVYEGVGDQTMETIKTETHTYDCPDRTPAQTQEGKESNTIYHTVGQHPSQPITAVTDHTIYSVVCKQPPAKRPDTTVSNTRKQTEDRG